ncbi:MAG TPA: hypothetical protein EYP99_03660 [Candidatus Poseidoniales archaeon]|nr:hypothetical protein [Candidatus Poseidoniales archaeon]
MSRTINFDSRLKVIARHGRILLWIIREEDKGNLSRQKTLDYIESTDVTDSKRIMSNLIESGSISIIDDKIRVNLSVKNFIQWANDSSEILPASRIESMLKDVMEDIGGAHNFLKDENLNERERFAHSEQRLIVAENTLNDLWGISDQNLRHVVLTSSELRLAKDKDPLSFMVKVSKIWEKDITPMSDFRTSSSELSRQRRNMSDMLYYTSNSSNVNNVIRKAASRTFQSLEDTWDYLAKNHDLMQTEMRPLYDMVEKMRGTLRVLRGAEAVLETLNKRTELNIDEELRVCRTAPRDLFSNNSIDSFLVNLFNSNDESDLSIPIRQKSPNDIPTPINLSNLIKNHSETEDLLDLVLESEYFKDFSLHECVEAVYSAIQGVEIRLVRDSERRKYTKADDKFALSALPLQMKVK